MKERIELLMKLGLPETHATDFVKNLANEAYSAGYLEGMYDKPEWISMNGGILKLKIKQNEKRNC